MHVSLGPRGSSAQQKPNSDEATGPTNQQPIRERVTEVPEGDLPDGSFGNRRILVELDEADFATLKKILGSLGGADCHTEDATDEQAGKRLAELLFEMRDARSRLFPASMFNEPAWDILMALYVADEAPTAADLARWTKTPMSSATRWLEYLEGHKLIIREARPDDRRSYAVRLTDEARANMSTLFSKVVDNVA